jgi:hypothetical protein
MKKYLLITFILFAFFSACTSKKNGTNDNGYIIPPEFGISAGDGDALRVYVADSEREVSDNWHRATEIAQSQGFNIVFKPHRERNGTDSLLHLMETYPGGVYLPSNNELDAYNNALPDKALLNNKIIGDVYAQARDYAPAYLQYVMGFNAPGELLFMPTNFLGYTEQLCLLIKTDLYDAFNDDIEDLHDIERLLRFKINSGFDSKPGLVSYYNFYKALLWDRGYITLDDMFYGGSYNHAVPTNLWGHKENGGIYSYLDLLEECAQSVALYRGWTEAGLIDDFNGYYIWGEHPVIIADLHTIKHAINHLGLGGQFNGYTLKALPGMKNDYYSVWSFAVASLETDVSEFLRFMEWLHDDPLHYTLFMCGDEGTEYGHIDGAYVGIMDSGYAKWSRRHNRNFLREDLDLALYNHYVYGFAGYPGEIINAPDFAYFELNEEIKNAGKRLYHETEYRQSSLGRIVPQEVSWAIHHIIRDNAENLSPDAFLTQFNEWLNHQFGTGMVRRAINRPKLAIEEIPGWFDMIKTP